MYTAVNAPTMRIKVLSSMRQHCQFRTSINAIKRRSSGIPHSWSKPIAGSAYRAVRPYRLITSLIKLRHSWYAFVPLVLVLAIGAAILVAMWLDRKG